MKLYIYILNQMKHTLSWSFFFLDRVYSREETGTDYLAQEGLFPPPPSPCRCSDYDYPCAPSLQGAGAHPPMGVSKN